MPNVPNFNQAKKIADIEKEIKDQLQLMRTKEKELKEREEKVKLLNEEILSHQATITLEKKHGNRATTIPIIQQEVFRKNQEFHTKENALEKTRQTIQKDTQELRALESKVGSIKSDIEKKTAAKKNANKKDESAKPVVEISDEKIQKDKKDLMEKRILVDKLTKEIDATQKNTAEENLEIQSKEDEMIRVKQIIQKLSLEIQVNEAKLKSLEVEISHKTLRKSDIGEKRLAIKKLNDEMLALHRNIDEGMKQATQVRTTPALPHFKQDGTKEEANLLNEENDLLKRKLAIQQEIRSMEQREDILEVEVKEKSLELKTAEEKLKAAQTTVRESSSGDTKIQQYITEKKNLLTKEAAAIPTLKREINELRANQFKKHNELVELQKALQEIKN